MRPHDWVRSGDTPNARQTTRFWNKVYVLDTDHMSILRRGGSNALRLQLRLSEVPDVEIVTCVIVYEEQMRGWMSEVARMRSGSQFILPYDALIVNLSIYCAMQVLPFDARAAVIFDDLKRQRIRGGTQDLKIAAIVIANNAVLLTRNKSDFDHVPDLRIEVWCA